MTKRQPPKGDAQPDLFVAAFADIPIRDQKDTMERPFFSLAKKPRLTSWLAVSRSRTAIGWRR
jgi:hypothetical protein